MAFDLGADRKVFHVVDKTHSITEVLKRDLEAFEVWSRLVIPLLHINDTNFITENKLRLLSYYSETCIKRTPC